MPFSVDGLWALRMTPANAESLMIVGAAGGVLLLCLAFLLLCGPSPPSTCAVVTDIHRYAIKGLAPDVLDEVDVTAESGGIPGDRSWAIMKGHRLEEFDPNSPAWVHKKEFFGAYTAAGPLSKFATSYEDVGCVLTIRDTRSGAVLRADLSDDGERASAERLLAAALGDQATPGLRIVSAVQRTRHHFGNTNAGQREGSGDLRVLHIVSRSTVRELGRTIGRPNLDPMRFRANILIDGSKPWEEFAWVGRAVQFGSVTLKILSRTIRCDATCTNPATGEQDLNIPELLEEHYPEHGRYLGVYAQVVSGGELSVGEMVSVGDFELAVD